MNAWLSGCTEYFVDLPELRMHYVSAGPPDGEAVILLHGFPEFWYSWRFQIPALARAGYRIVAPDQRGYNLSGKDGPYDVGTLTRDIAHLQDALGLATSHIVGHDWGGAIAWAFAAAFPARTGKLIIMNAPQADAFQDTLRRHPQQIVKSWYILLFQLPFLPELAFRLNNYRVLERAFAHISPTYMTATDVQRYKDACAQPGALPAMIGWYRAAMPLIVGRRSRDAPETRVNAPTCVIWGENDDFLDRRCNDTLRNYVAQLDLHFLGDASHWVQMDQPDKVNRIMLGFLQ